MSAAGVEPIVALDDLRYAWTPRAAPVLDLARLEIAAGERLFIEGPSGSGKSTLLGLLAGVVIPQRGSVRVLGERLEALPAGARDRFRADHIGYIFQLFNLIPYLSVVENVTLPLRFSARRAMRAARLNGGAVAEALRLLAHLGLDDAALLAREVTGLSVGQQQRVAAARALIGRPELVIADEPTSALDAAQREAFLQLLFRECAAAGSTLVFVSHDRAFEALFDRTLRLPEINRVREAAA